LFFNTGVQRRLVLQRGPRDEVAVEASYERFSGRHRKLRIICAKRKGGLRRSMLVPRGAQDYRPERRTISLCCGKNENNIPDTKSDSICASSTRRRSHLNVQRPLLGLLLTLWVAFPPRTRATELTQPTAFERYVQLTEVRMQSELADPENFLHLNSLPKKQRDLMLARLHSGYVVIEQMSTRENGKEIQVTYGLAINWRLDSSRAPRAIRLLRWPKTIPAIHKSMHLTSS
jgi:hypothetical protein